MRGLVARLGLVGLRPALGGTGEGSVGPGSTVAAALGALRAASRALSAAKSSSVTAPSAESSPREDRVRVSSVGATAARPWSTSCARRRRRGRVLRRHVGRVDGLLEQDSLTEAEGKLGAFFPTVKFVCELIAPGLQAVELRGRGGAFELAVVLGSNAHVATGTLVHSPASLGREQRESKELDVFYRVLSRRSERFVRSRDTRARAFGALRRPRRRSLCFLR